MEEINVNQEMEKAVEEAVLPNYKTLGSVALGTVVTGVAVYGIYKGYKAVKKRLNKKAEAKDQTEVVEAEVTKTEEVSED